MNKSFALVLMMLGSCFAFSQNSVEERVKQLQILYPLHPDSVIGGLNEDYDAYVESRNFISAGVALSAMSYIAVFSLNNPDLALVYANRLDSLRNATGIDELKVVSAELNGKLNAIANQFELSSEYFDTAIQLSLVTDFRVSRNYVNKGVSEMNLGRPSEARIYFDSASSRIEENDFYSRSNLYHNKGGSFMVEGLPDSAKKCFDTALNFARLGGDSTQVFEELYILSRFYLAMWQTTNDPLYADSSEQALTKLMNNLDYVSSYERRSFIYDGLYQIANDRNDLRKALDYYTTYTDYDDTLFELDMRKAMLLNEFKLSELEYQQHLSQLELDKQKLMYAFWWSLGLLILLVTFSVVWYKQIKRNKALEEENIQLEKQTNQKVIAAKSVVIMGKDQVMRESLTLIDEFFKKNPDIEAKGLQEVKTNLKTSITNQTWEEIEEVFNQANPLFVKNLMKKHPDLSLNDRKLCVFIYMKMSSKDIQQLTGQSINTINVGRFRLRKKLDLKDQSVSILSYLSSI